MHICVGNCQNWPGRVQNQIDDQVYKFPHLILNQVELLEHIYIQQFKIDERKIKLFDDTANV